MLEGRGAEDSNHEQGNKYIDGNEREDIDVRNQTNIHPPVDENWGKERM